MSRLATIITSTDPAGLFANVPFVVREQLVWILVLQHVPHAKVTSDDLPLLWIEVDIFHWLFSVAFFRRNARRKEVGKSGLGWSRLRCTKFILGSGTILSVPFGRSSDRREIQILLTDTSLYIVSFTSMFRCRYERGTSSNRRRKAMLSRPCGKQSATTERPAQAAARRSLSSAHSTSNVLIYQKPCNYSIIFCLANSFPEF